MESFCKGGKTFFVCGSHDDGMLIWEWRRAGDLIGWNRGPGAELRLIAKTSVLTI